MSGAAPGGRPRVVIATHSAHKLRELRELLSLRRTDVVSLDELGVSGEPVEDGLTFETNARIKARFAAGATGLPALADDSGIEVDALDGGPGVRTRRYAGEQATDLENNAKLLAALDGLAPAERGARYVCVLAFATPLPGGRSARDRHRPGNVPWAHRGRPKGQRRLRVRPDLRARFGAAGRPHARGMERGREERDLAPGSRGSPDEPKARDARVLMRRVCVFCGASAGNDPAYAALARSVGEGLARRGIGIVYGGGRVGLMGVVADAALATGGEVIGVIPRSLVDRELAHPGATEMRIVGTLHERKALMAELSDAFVALPGGLGTLEELAEVVSWAQLGLHTKPIGLLGVRGYWDDLLRWLDGAVAAGFVPPANRDLMVEAADLDELLTRFDAA